MADVTQEECADAVENLLLPVMAQWTSTPLLTATGRHIGHGGWSMCETDCLDHHIQVPAIRLSNLC